MKKDINAALRRLEPGSPHAASNTDLLRGRLTSEGVPFSFLDRPDTLLAKLIVTAGAVDDGGASALPIPLPAGQAVLMELGQAYVITATPGEEVDVTVMSLAPQAGGEV